jgi:diaminopimelate decarboxylase
MSLLPELHLTNPNASIDPATVDWLSQHAKSLRLITLDVSHLLVENAGATCARIIGVRQSEAGKIHYYIDDGCYGSLSNHSKNNVPLPLKAGSDSSTSVDSDDDDSQELIATVWGPTCDGLDKVCVGKLPKLCRDDWLVFGNTGFCDVGTAFNGFSPPDVVHCVLGGFLYASDKWST